MDENYKEKQAEIEILELSLEEPEENLKLIQSMIGDMSLLDESQQDVEQKQIDLANLKKKLPAENISNRSTEEVQAEYTQITGNLKKSADAIDYLQKQYKNISERIQQEQESLNKMISQKIELQKVIQELGSLKIRLDEIVEIKKDLMEKMRNEEGLINPLQVKLEKLEQTKKGLKSENDRKVEEEQSDLERKRAMKNELLRLDF